MDFNTGTGGTGRSGDRDGPSEASPGGFGPEFSLSDPVGSLIAAVRSIVLNPVGFFQALPRRGGFVNPLVFALVCTEVAVILGGIRVDLPVGGTDR